MKLIDRFIYSITKKPKHYVEVKNPPKTTAEKLSRPQDARQVQYNRWSKRYKMYSGSYLPKDHKDLANKGWKKKNVRRGRFINDHYHWYIWNRNYFGPKTEQHFRIKQRKHNNTEKVYYNKYGEKTSFGNPDHHINPSN